MPSVSPNSKTHKFPLGSKLILSGQPFKLEANVLVVPLTETEEMVPDPYVALPV